MAPIGVVSVSPVARHATSASTKARGHSQQPQRGMLMWNEMFMKNTNPIVIGTNPDPQPAASKTSMRPAPGAASPL